MKKSGHQLKALIALAGLVLSIVMIPISAAHAEPWTTTGYSGTGSRFMAADRAGNLYVANLSSNTVTKITPAGVATKCGETGLSPRGIAIDASGNIYTSNTGDNTVTKITPTCEFKKDFGLTGSSPFNLAIDQAGNIYTANYGSDNVSKITPEGISTQDYVYLGAHTAPSGIATDQAGNLYVTNCGPHNIENFTPIDDVRKITPERVVTIVGTTGQCPGALVFDSSGNIYTSNQASTFVSKITPAGVSTSEFAPTGGTLPYSLAIDPLGNIYVANATSNNIGKITPGGESSILGTTGDSGPRGIIYSSGNIYAVNVDGTFSKFSLTTTISGSAPNSQVATISSGVTGVVMPSTAALPATTINFGGTVPASVTVSPVASNPASAAATPFTISGSTKIVDIQIPGTLNGTATVCLDGLPTDHLFHFTGGAWVELPSRTYALGQVCGVTTSFSPFAAAAPALIAAPAFTLNQGSEQATVGKAISGYTIASTGGAIASYSISPAIGNGLTFNTSTGLISGTPTASAAAVTYTITGTNSGSSVSTTYRITVNAAPVMVPDPLQQSKITSISASTAIAGTSTPLVISGSFVEKISAIQINGVALAAGSWSQTATSVSFTLPGKSAGTYQIQLFNGSAPVLKVQSFTFTAPIVAATPTPTPNPTAKAKVIYIRCVKAGRGTRIAYGVNPVCPAGFTRQ